MTLLPRRVRDQEGRWALVDGITFDLPVRSEKTPALMAAFPINADHAALLMPGDELHPFRLFGKGLLVITVVDYRKTNIGKYIEYSIAIACTHGRSPAPPLLPVLFQKTFGLGQYVYDLPVSSEISEKGGKGIWGMPKHKASLDFLEDDHTVSSQYNLGGELAMRIDVDKPSGFGIPIFNLPAANYCAFRGMLFKSNVYFSGKIGMSVGKKGAARLTMGDQPSMRVLKELEVGKDPVFTAYFPETRGVLDDHFECWFLSSPMRQTMAMPGMETVVKLGLSEDWLESPRPAGSRIT
jgi:hypothetical protein